MKVKITTAEIEKTVCDGEYIMGITGLFFINKSYAAAYALTAINADLVSLCEALSSAERRVKYAYGFELLLRPCPASFRADSNAEFKEAAELIIRDINRDFKLLSFSNRENDGTLLFSFELLIPSEYEKNNAELLLELKNQFRKLSNKIALSVTIIRARKNKYR